MCRRKSLHALTGQQKESKANFVLIEIGGTVGEYENILFLEALRMMRMRDPSSVRTILVSYLPVPPSIGK